MPENSWIKIHTTDVTPSDSAHTSGLREAASATAIVAVGGFVYASATQPEVLERFWFWFVLFGLAAAAGFATYRFMANVKAPHRDVSPEALRAARAEDQERKIAQARARGDFDRFGK